jgi:hypothetical protein
MPVILATQEAEIRRIMVWNQPKQMVCETLSKYLTKGLVEWHGSRFGPWVQAPVLQNNNKNKNIILSERRQMSEKILYGHLQKMSRKGESSEIKLD